MSYSSPQLVVENFVVIDPSERDEDAVDTHIVHRISFAEDDGSWGGFDGVSPIPDDELAAHHLISRFADTRTKRIRQGVVAKRPGAYTGGKQPYSFLLRTSGIIHQVASVSDITPHAARWNRRAVSTAVAGNFTRHDPTWIQENTLAVWLALWLAFGQRVLGHTEAGGSADPKKECPGAKLKLPLVRNCARAHPYAKLSPQEAREKLEGFGVIF